MVKLRQDSKGNYIARKRLPDEHTRIPQNAFADAKVTLPRAIKLREKALRPEEWRTVLKAALEIADVGTPDNAAKRWVPWLGAYTGARPGELLSARSAFSLPSFSRTTSACRE